MHTNFCQKNEGKRPLTRPRLRCEDHIKMDLGFLVMAMSLQVLYQEGVVILLNKYTLRLGRQWRNLLGTRYQIWQKNPFSVVV